jgi:integrase
MTSELHKIVESTPRGHIAKSTKARYLKDLDVWIGFAGDDPAGWTRDKAQDFYNHLLAKGLKPQSANRLMASVHFASKWWAHRQNRDELHFAIVQMSSKRNEIEKHALTEDEARKLLDTCANYPTNPIDLRDRALIVIALETGMRKMSLRSMEIENTIFDAHKIRHARLLCPTALVHMKGSDDARIPVPLSDACVHVLQPWIAWLAGKGRESGPLFTALLDRGNVKLALDRKSLTDTAIQKLVSERAEAAQIGHCYPHLFRHTFVTWRSAMGLTPFEIASITGHVVRDVGALGHYMDMRAIGDRVRNNTPAWLRTYLGIA